MSSKKTNKGRRYSAEEKQDIVNFVTEYNEKNGRGGQSAASKKFNVSPLTISSWLKSSGKAPAKKKRGRKASKAAKGVKAPAAATASGPIGKKLDQLQKLHDDIERTEAHLNKLRAQFDSLKSSL